MPVTRQTVTEPDGGQRLDRWFRQHFPALGHGRLEKLLRTGQVRVNGKRVKAGHRLSAGEEIRVPPLDPVEREAATANRQTKRQAGSAQEDRRFLESITLFRDETVLILNKPAGLPVQGGSGQSRHLDGMLQNLTRSSESPRLVHRLDKDTSGVITIGLTRQAAAALASAFRGREVRKLYWAVAVGTPARRRGVIDLSLAKRGGPAGERVVVGDDAETGAKAANARAAQTRFAVIDHAANQVTWLGLLPLTGRTHQLRAHTAAMDAPILGDGKYGGSDAFVTGLSRQLHLHARRLIVPHPSGGWIDAEAVLPPHMADTFETMGFDPRDDTDPFGLDALRPAK